MYAIYTRVCGLDSDGVPLASLSKGIVACTAHFLKELLLVLSYIVSFLLKVLLRCWFVGCASCIDDEEATVVLAYFWDSTLPLPIHNV